MHCYLWMVLVMFVAMSVAMVERVSFGHMSLEEA